jgi:dipeptidyl aminopeptidase/acylaminoacyl peptidase
MMDHAMNDTVVPPNQSPIFSELLKHRGKRYEYLEPAGEDHWFSTGSLHRVLAIVRYVILHNIHYAN